MKLDNENRESRTMKSREGGQREILEKDMVKWKKNENLEEVNLRQSTGR